MPYVSKNFKRSEFACNCGCGFDTIDAGTLKALQLLRDHFGKPVTVNSAARCLEYNRSVGSTDRSQHVRGRAVDVSIDGVTPAAIATFLMNSGLKLSVGIYPTFVHFDTRSGKPTSWRGQ